MTKVKTPTNIIDVEKLLVDAAKVRSPIIMQPVLVTPEMANYWLQYCNTHNRRLNNNLVPAMVVDMLAGNWKLTFDPIWILNGVLINGQHRLKAIVASGTSQYMIVYTGTDFDPSVLDSGKVRSPRDLTGYAGQQLSGDQIVIARRLSTEHILWNHKLTTHSIIAFYNLYKDGIDFAIAHCKVKGRNIDSYIKTVIAAAYYHVDKVNLADFCKCLDFNYKSTCNIEEMVNSVSRWAAAGYVSTENKPNLGLVKSHKAKQRAIMVCIEKCLQQYLAGKYTKTLLPEPTLRYTLFNKPILPKKTISEDKLKANEALIQSQVMAYTRGL